MQRIGNELITIATTAGQVGEPAITLVHELMKFFQ
jgi:hypothetical protein